MWFIWYSAYSLQRKTSNLKRLLFHNQPVRKLVQIRCTCMLEWLIKELQIYSNRSVITFSFIMVYFYGKFPYAILRCSFCCCILFLRNTYSTSIPSLNQILFHWSVCTSQSDARTQLRFLSCSFANLSSVSIIYVWGVVIATLQSRRLACGTTQAGSMLQSMTLKRVCGASNSVPNSVAYTSVAMASCLSYSLIFMCIDLFLPRQAACS